MSNPDQKIDATPDSEFSGQLLAKEMSSKPDTGPEYEFKNPQEELAKLEDFTVEQTGGNPTNLGGLLEFAKSIDRLSAQLKPEERARAYNELNAHKHWARGGAEAEMDEILERLKMSAFGEAGPELIDVHEKVNSGVYNQPWHGKEVYLAVLGNTQATWENDLTGKHADLVLLRKGDGTWIIRGYVGEEAEIGRAGLTLGRQVEEKTPGLERITKTIEEDMTVSRKHLRLEPKADGSIDIVDLSQNGTFVSEHYWAARTPDSNPAVGPQVVTQPEPSKKKRWFGRK